MKGIHKILIANRGEIAVRIIRTARKMGIDTVAIYSRVDTGGLHVTLADESWCIGEVELAETYLNIPKIIATAKQTGCDAIHPGYGFLAENPLFADACQQAGIIFIGPSARSMQIMGNKISAREFVKPLNIPMTAGLTGTKEELFTKVRDIGFPVLLKAAAGGGGKGMQIVNHEKELAEALESASRQAKAYFDDDTIYVEKFIEEPRHVEFQILGDQFGHVIHLFERECSIQRRYQKIIEESPSPTLTPDVRKKMGEAAVSIGKAIGYDNAGTIEFLVDQSLNFYFLEMNTRIQVEHPVTEMTTGIDIVEEQILIAEGQPLRWSQEEIQPRGHAIECRIYAEDPANNFRPSPGKMILYKEPGLDGIRIDTSIAGNTEIKSSFDPMISKLIVLGKDRQEAGLQMLAALHDYVIHGIKTNIPYLVELVQSDAFFNNSISTRFCDTHTPAILSAIEDDKAAIPSFVPITGYLLYSLQKRQPANSQDIEKQNLWERIGYWRNQMQLRLRFESEEVSVDIQGNRSKLLTILINSNQYQAVPVTFAPNRIEFMIDHHHYSVWVSEDDDNQASVSLNGHIFQLKRHDLLTEMVVASGFDKREEDVDHLIAPLPGKVIKVMVQAGDQVKKGDPLLVIEAMKMENLIISNRDGKIRKVSVALNERVESSMVLVEFEK